MFVKEIPRRSLVDFPPPTPQATPCRLWQGARYGVTAGAIRKVRTGKTWPEVTP